jgi:hypothetical protein
MLFEYLLCAVLTFVYLAENLVKSAFAIPGWLMRKAR